MHVYRVCTFSFFTHRNSVCSYVTKAFKVVQIYLKKQKTKLR